MRKGLRLAATRIFAVVTNARSITESLLESSNVLINAAGTKRCGGTLTASRVTSPDS